MPEAFSVDGLAVPDLTNALSQARAHLGRWSAIFCGTYRHDQKARPDTNLHRAYTLGRTQASAQHNPFFQNARL